MPDQAGQQSPGGLHSDPGCVEESESLQQFPVKMGVGVELRDYPHEDGTFEAQILWLVYRLGAAPESRVVWSMRGEAVQVIAAREGVFPLLCGLCASLNAGVPARELWGVFHEGLQQFASLEAVEILPGWELLSCKVQPMKPSYIYYLPGTDQAATWSPEGLSYMGTLQEVLDLLTGDESDAEDPEG